MSSNDSVIHRILKCAELQASLTEMELMYPKPPADGDHESEVYANPCFLG